MSAKILASEKYMNDASSTIYDNWFQTLKRREEMSVWGPVEISTQGKSVYSYLHNQRESQNDINNIATKAQTVESIPVSGYCHQKVDIECSLRSALTTRLSYGVNDNKERMNSNLFDLKAPSTKNIHEDVNPGNPSRRLRYNENAKADMESDFHNWCKNRKREHKLSSSPTQTVDPVSKVVVTEIQDFSNREPVVNKSECGDILLESDEQNMFEYPVSFEKRIFKDDTCTVDKRILCKTNLSHDADDRSMDIKQIINNIKSQTSKKEIGICEYYDSKCQKGPEIAEEMFKDGYFSESNTQFSDEMSAMEYKEQHYDTSPKTKVTEKVVLNANTKETISTDKNLGQRESTKTNEFITKAHDKNEKQYEKKNAHKPKFHQNLTYEVPPRFRKNMDEKGNVSSEKQTVPKKVHPEKKLLKEVSLKKSQKKKENCDILVSSESMCKNRQYSGQKTQIRITDERGDKNFEFVADSVVLSRIKRTLPKLSADIPDVDSDSKEIHYSADAMNIILRFVFCRSYKINMPSAVTGVEVLAAAQTWQLNETDSYKLFHQEFLQNVLTSANAALVLFYANQYNLKEIVDVCKANYSANVVMGTNTPRKRTKKCHVSISTYDYVEPSEITIPFKPIARDMSSSFKRGIRNNFTFEVISGCYSITGFEIQLNEEYILPKEENKNMLEIDYSVENGDGNQKIEERIEKPLRSINRVYFKKPLVIKPREKGEITVETEIEPYLCSTYQEKKIRIRNAVNELDLTMESNWKPKPDMKLILVRKFLYHVTEFPKNIKV